MSHDYDLLVIGAGMAGVSAAQKAASAGWTVAVADRLPYGGTCALRGCDPKKILRRGAEIVDAARLLEGKGLAPGTGMDWPAAMRHKRGFTDPVPEKFDADLRKAGVDTFHDAVRFTGPNSVEVEGQRLTARHFLVAAGARPRPLDFPGHDLLADNGDFLDLDELPPRIVFVGGGLVSFEFAHIAARAGADVTIVNRGPRPLKQFDPHLVDLLVEGSRSTGIDVRLDTDIASVERGDDTYRVRTQQGSEVSELHADLVVHGAGRVPDLEDLDLDSGGIAHGPRGVEVAAHLQSTTNPAVYAAGDAADTEGLPLTPVAVFEGKVAVSNMTKGSDRKPDYSGVPSAVYTLPELVRVGMSEQEARDSGRDVDVRFKDTSDWFSSYRIGAPVAATKILVDRQDDTILGAHLLGHDYAEVANTIAVAMRLGIPARQLRSVTAAYPTVGSDLGSML